MSVRREEGCRACRDGAYSGRWPPPERLGTAAGGWSFLHRCEICGSYWVFNVREAHVVAESDARTEFPEIFGGRPPTKPVNE